MTDGLPPQRSRRLTRPMEQAAISLLQQRAGVELHVFVAGPYIEGGWTEDERLAKTPSARLRLALHDFVKDELLYIPVLGEHRGTIEMGDDNLRSKATVVHTEFHILKKQCQAVVILPDSPGSFSELGAWSRDREICRKMLIIADITHKDKQGYVQMGVFKLSVDRGAQLVWENYENVSAIRLIVQDFLLEIHDQEVSLAVLPD